MKKEHEKQKGWKPKKAVSNHKIWTQEWHKIYSINLQNEIKNKIKIRSWTNPCSGLIKKCDFFELSHQIGKV